MRTRREDMPAVIFDLDGTLADNRKLVWKSWNLILHALTGNPKTFSLEEVKSAMGLPMDEIVKRLFLPRFGEGQGRAYGEKAMLYEVDYIAEKGAHPIQGVLGMLRRLHGKYRLYIVSNCQKGYIEAFLSSTGTAPFFEGHVSWGESPRSKGENIALLMKKEGIVKALYVGDTSLDQESASFAGIPFVHASYGFGKVEGALYEASRPSEIPALVREVFGK